jgi:hypothetical protein
MEIEIEISYAASDPVLAGDIAGALASAEDVSASEPREARLIDPTAIIGLVGGVISLTNALIDLRERVRKRKACRRGVIAAGTTRRCTESPLPRAVSCVRPGTCART